MFDKFGNEIEDLDVLALSSYYSLDLYVVHKILTNQFNKPVLILYSYDPQNECLVNDFYTNDYQKISVYDQWSKLMKLSLFSVPTPLCNIVNKLREEL